MKILVLILVCAIIIGILAAVISLITGAIGLIGSAINAVLGIAVLAALIVIVAWMFSYAKRK